MLSRRWSKDRLLSTCFVDLPALAFAPKVRAFNNVVFKGRWGDLGPALRSAWSKRKYLFGVDAAPAEREDGGINIQQISDAVESKFFWAYLSMICRGGDVLRHLAGWSEGCPCHPLPERTDAARGQSRNDLMTDIGMHSCPMATRRAAECACGAVDNLVDELFTTRSAELLFDDVLREASPEERGRVLQDFAALRRHVVFTLNIKLSFWKQLPWIAFGISHHEVNQAIAAGSRMLALYDELVNTQHQHWVVNERSALQAVWAGASS